MKNQIYKINQSELLSLKQSIKKSDNIYIIEIDGKKLKTLESYLSGISKI